MKSIFYDIYELRNLSKYTNKMYLITKTGGTPIGDIIIEVEVEE